MDSSRTVAAESDLIGTYRPCLSNLADDLVRVDLDICAWRGTVPIAPSDLGLEESEEFDETLREYLRLGRKRLLPSRYAQERERIERQAREVLRRYSYETELGGLVPKVRWPALREQLLVFKAQYDQLVAEITSAQLYPAICEELRTIYTRAAIQAWKIRQGLKRATAPVGDGPALLPETPEEFVKNFLARIVQAIPSPEVMRRKFGFSWTVRYLELPSRVEEELRQAELTRLKLQAEKERIEAELERERVTDAAEREQQRLELESVTRRLAAEEAVAREVAEKTKAELEEKFNRASTLVESALRGMLYDLSVDVLGCIQRNGRLPVASARRIRNLVERVRLLNYRDEADIEDLVRKLEEVVPSDVKGQDPQIITTTLRELATVTRAELLALGETPRSGTAVGISDEIEVSTYRRAREALSRDLPVLPAAAGRRGVRTNTPVGTELLL